MSDIKRFFVCIGMVFLLVSNVQAKNPEELFELGYEAFVKRDYTAADGHWTLASKLNHMRAQNGL